MSYNDTKYLAYSRFSVNSLLRFSTSPTNAPRLLSRAKAGTHSALLKGSHTTAHTPKQGPSLPRPQCGFVLPAKSPPKEQPEKADARLWRASASSGVAAPLGCATLFSICPCCISHTRRTGISARCEIGVVSLPPRTVNKTAHICFHS